MKVDEERLIALLAGNRQFVVPIYQRTYDWHRDNCKQLYDDIIQAGKGDEKKTHFMGVITYHSPQEALQDTSRHQLIDGQQRITTIMLFLVALKREYGDQISERSLLKIDQLLHNTIEPEQSDRYFKMRLNPEDNNAFDDILKNKRTDNKGNIRANFEHICKWLSKVKNTIDFEVIWRGIQRLTIVHIAIGNYDNAQLIFESMNSTGLNLSQTDLIQNYLLMSDKPSWQNNVYAQYWSPMENIFEDDRDMFDEYLRCYIVMKQCVPIPKRLLYTTFKKYAEPQRRESILVDLHKYAERYDSLVRSKEYKSERINESIHNIRAQNTNVAYPILLKILSDYEDGLINEDDTNELFKLIDSYTLRCAVAGTARNLNQAMLVILQKIDPNNYRKSIEQAIMERSGTDRFPSDPVFKASFTQKEFHQRDPLCRYILGRLVRADLHGDMFKVEQFQIEHIMPQKLSTDWKNDLGNNYDEIHDTYMHRIGNLTLTEDNSSLSNNTFSEKQKIYIKSLIKLTNQLSNYEMWTDVEINRRSKELAEIAAEIWKYPEGHYHRQSEDDNETLERDHIYNTSVDSIWNKLKQNILHECPGSIFSMTVRYGNFKSKVPNSDKYRSFCSINATKHKIYVVYNTSPEENIIKATNFVKDVTKVGHYAPGSFRSTIYGDEDISSAVSLAKLVWSKKHNK